MYGAFTAVVWQSVFRTISGQAEPECFATPQTSSFGSAEYGPDVARAIGCGGHCPLFIFSTYVAPRKDHVRIVGPCVGLASHLCHMWGPLSDLQRFLDFSNGAAVSQCACLTTPRPVGPPCELPANLVRVASPMMSSNPPSMEAPLAHACRPLFYTHVPPTKTAVRSVPVSAC